jgi:hypothetical protein
MSDDWLDELRKIRDEDQARVQAQTDELDLSVLKRKNQAIDVQRQSDAHNLLRQVQKVLLDGKGVIDILDATQQYDRAITLKWQGPIALAQPPRTEDPEDYHYILIGAKGDKLFVNDRLLKSATPEMLRSALIWASKNPLRQSNKEK